MAVVHVGNVGMLVQERPVYVRVRVGLSRRVERPVLVLVMLVVDVSVLVLHELVEVDVVVLLAEQQGDAEAHEAGCCQLAQANGGAGQRDGSGCPDEGCRRKEGRFTRCAE